MLSFFCPLTGKLPIDERNKMNELALFAGAGGGILGGKLLGWRTVCAVEYASAPRSMLLARQRDGCLERFPIWDDVRTFDGKPWRGKVDIVTGGFPCQDISSAGKGAGIDGERSGLWSEMQRIVGEVRPRYTLIENSPNLTFRGLDRVLCDLAKMGYDATWGVFSAGDAGAQHERERCWIVGHSVQRGCTPKSVQQEQDIYRERSKALTGNGLRKNDSAMCDWWKTEPSVGRVVNGMADGMDRVAAIGNGQVPAVVRLAWETLSGL